MEEPVKKEMYRQAAAERRAPQWVLKNMDKIDVIARKQYNQHDFAENLRLAFSFPGKIEPMKRGDPSR